MSEKPIRVLVVDDSAFMRHMILKQLESEPLIQVVGTARDGVEAVEKAAELRPDCITLDVEMPRMDGLVALARIMRQSPTAVVMLSAMTSEGAEATIEALRLGAIDFVCKPSGTISLHLYAVREDLIRKIKMAVRSRLPSTLPTVRGTARAVSEPKPVRPAGSFPRQVVVIGSSTGGPRALYQLIPALPRDLPAAVLIVQHMPPGFTRSLAEGLDRGSQLSVAEASAGDRLETGLVLVAPGDHHMVITPEHKVHLDHQTPRLNGVRPSVDVTLSSVAQVFGSAAVGVILTGMGRDGTRGALELRARGGRVVAEDEASCVVFGMPRSVIEEGAATAVVPLPQMADEIVRLVSQ